MIGLLKAILNASINFLRNGLIRSVLIIVILGLVAFLNYYSLGLARRTFVFYTIREGILVVEDRMVKKSNSKEEDIIRYTEEVLLGPVAQDLLPLFLRETRLKTLLFRDGVVYADFTSDAAMPVFDGSWGLTQNNFKTLYDGVFRNFSYVKEVRFFIEGRAVYVEGFYDTVETAQSLQM